MSKAGAKRREGVRVVVMGRVGRPRKSLLPRTPNGEIRNDQSYRSKAPCSLYVMCMDGANFVKIGISHSPAQRAAAIQVNSPHRVYVARVWRLGDEARMLETECHRRLRQTHAHQSGEWYRMQADAAEEFIRKVATSIDIDLERASA